MKHAVFICFLFLLCAGVSLSGDESTTAGDVLIGREEPSRYGALQALILFYQEKVSVHDEGRCLFYPTCSDFYRRAIDAYGVLWATLMVIDRLLYRESEWSMKYYPYLEHSGRLFDPIHHNYIFRRSDYYR